MSQWKPKVFNGAGKGLTEHCEIHLLGKKN